MGEKDTKAKEYLADNERFADLCNYVLFGGEQVITADALEERDTTEILSGFHKDDCLTPVITITLYWGEDQWDGPRSLHEMFQKVDERLRPYLPDYRINLVVPQEIKDFHSFRTALGAVLEMIKMSGDEQEMNRLMENQELFSAMDNESIEVINTFIGTEIPYNEPEGGNNVCKAWDDHKESGRIEGRIEEIFASVRDGDYSAARGAEKLGISVQELEKRMTEAGYPLPLVK